MKPITNTLIVTLIVATFAIFSQAQPGIAQETIAQETTPAKVTLQKDANGKWHLLRNGQPYTIRGAGGSGSLNMLAEVGGNSVRTWGVGDDTPGILDDAQANGISVAMGLWLEHERHGMDYEDFDKVTEQIEKTMDDVRKLKDHPAILIWGVGNEMEVPETGDNPAVWLHVEHLARMIKDEDPNHPVMTVIAEIGGRKVEAIHKLCPSVDIIGINSYGGCASVPERYRELASKLAEEGIDAKPYVVTEFGPTGWWEVGKNDIDTVEEAPSTEKATVYENAYTALQEEKQLHLGSYAFLWGNKQETTATWFGMLLPDGRKTAAVDTMSRLWTGKPVKNLCPTIKSLKLEGKQLVDGGSTVSLQLDASDPEGEPINVHWVMVSNKEAYGTGGDYEEASKSLAGALIKGDEKGATFKVPTPPGLYRLYAYVDDGNGAAVANVPIRVKGAEMAATGGKTKLPVVIYDEPDDKVVYIPSGYMGATDAIKLEPASKTQPAKGDHCMQVTYENSGDWGGVVWQHPENDWGEKQGGLDLTGAKRLRFSARGKAGGEKVKFGVGLIGRDMPFFDTAKKEREVTLTTEWKEYEFDLQGSDLTRIKSGFFWSLAGQGDPITFYLDNIAFE